MCVEVNIRSECFIYDGVRNEIFVPPVIVTQTRLVQHASQHAAETRQLSTTALHINKTHPNTLNLLNRCLTKPPRFKQFDPSLLKHNVRTPGGLGPDLKGEWRVWLTLVIKETAIVLSRHGGGQCEGDTCQWVEIVLL